MVPIRGGWRVELIWRRFRQNSSNRSRTSSSCPTALAWTDAAKEIPPTPATTSGEEYYIAQKDKDLPIPTQKALPDDYERDDDDNKKYDKVAPRTLHPRPLLPSETLMIDPRGITTYSSLLERRFLTTMNAKTMTTKKYDKVEGGDILFVEAG